MIKTLKHNLLIPVYLILKLLFSKGVRFGAFPKGGAEGSLSTKTCHIPTRRDFTPIALSLGRKIHFLTCAYCYQIPTKINL